METDANKLMIHRRYIVGQNAGQRNVGEGGGDGVAKKIKLTEDDRF